MGVEKGLQSRPTMHQVCKVWQFRSQILFFVSLFEDPPARLDMSLKNFCFLSFCLKIPRHALDMS